MGTIETINQGGEIRLHRNPTVINKSGYNVFTLADLEEFTLQARLNDVTDNQSLTFYRPSNYHSQGPEYMYFPTEGNPLFGSTRVVREHFITRRLGTILITLFILGLVLGLLVGMVF